MKLSESVHLIGGAAYGLSAAGDCNVYLIDCGEKYAMIDAGAGNGVKEIIENIKQDGLEPKKISIVFLTHCHFDHIGGASKLKELTGCKIFAHEKEEFSIINLDENVLMEMALLQGINFKAPKLDRLLEDDDQFNLGNITFNIIHTPGHTPGCMSILIYEKDGKKALFTGDIASTTGKLGFINGPGFDLNDWKKSIKRLIRVSPDRIYPGHNTFMLSRATDDLKLTDQKMNSPWTTIVTSVG